MPSGFVVEESRHKTFSLSDSHKAAIKVSYCCVILLCSGADVVAGKIQFHLVVGCKSPFSCRLSTRKQSQLPDATSNSFTHDPLKGPLATWCKRIEHGDLLFQCHGEFHFHLLRQSYIMQCNPITFLIFY